MARADSASPPASAALLQTASAVEPPHALVAQGPPRTTVVAYHISAAPVWPRVSAAATPLIPNHAAAAACLAAELWALALPLDASVQRAQALALPLGASVQRAQEVFPATVIRPPPLPWQPPALLLSPHLRRCAQTWSLVASALPAVCADVVAGPGLHLWRPSPAQQAVPPAASLHRGQASYILGMRRCLGTCQMKGRLSSTTPLGPLRSPCATPRCRRHLARWRCKWRSHARPMRGRPGLPSTCCGVRANWGQALLPAVELVLHQLRHARGPVRPRHARRLGGARSPPRQCWHHPVWRQRRRRRGRTAARGRPRCPRTQRPCCLEPPVQLWGPLIWDGARLLRL